MIPSNDINFSQIASRSRSTARKALQRNTGSWQLKDAGFLIDSYDRMRLIEYMAATAMERLRMKEAYSKAKEIYHMAVGLNKKYRKEATRYKIKLPLSLSGSSENYLQILDKVRDQHFEIMYLGYMQQKLAEMVLQLRQYELIGKSKGLLAFYSAILMQILKVEKELTN
ncbi:MAG: hypothetical protein ACFHWX_12865 [Bacteroidota bacterium]